MITSPILLADPASGRYLLVQGWSVRVAGRLVDVPSGFAFDGASIPWVAEPLTYSPFDPKVMGAALVHDYAYATGALSRREADEAFRALLRRDGVAPWRAWIMFAAVRLFARCHYHGEAAPRAVGPDDITTPMDV